MNGEKEKIIIDPVQYEYKCPHCHCNNIRYNNCARLICSYCRKVFYG